jgi:hypothetical protein
MPQALSLGVRLDKGNLFLTAASETKVIKRHIINWEDRNC